MHLRKMVNYVAKVKDGQITKLTYKYLKKNFNCLFIKPKSQKVG